MAILKIERRGGGEKRKREVGQGEEKGKEKEVGEIRVERGQGVERGKGEEGEKREERGEKTKRDMDAEINIYFCVGKNYMYTNTRSKTTV